ncbi:MULTISPECIES: hypothetical protein [Kitasatospora]|uniref:Secreted protein n=1 Tax=Kitasatospora cystarginea TaxID=58350 RepID=A0ABN3EL69_9ACTN
MKGTKKQALAGVAGALGVLLALAGPAAAEQGTGQILPYPGPDGLIWIPEWIGDGGAVTGGASPERPFTVTVGCQGGGSVLVTVSPHFGDRTPVSFRVNCPVGATAVGSVVLTGEQGRDFYVGVAASDQTVRWGLTATQAD